MGLVNRDPRGPHPRPALLLPVIPYESLEEILDIIKALNQRASALQDKLGTIHQAVRALSGTKIGVRNRGRKFRHTAATKRKLRLAQKKIWAAKRERKPRTSRPVSLQV